MPRPYADVVGQFHRGRAGGIASHGDYEGAARAAQAVDPALAETYASMGDRVRTRSREQEMDTASRSYAQAIAGGDYENAAQTAARVGNVEGVTGARTLQAEITMQQRMEAWRALQAYADEVEGVAASPDPQAGWGALLARARQESAQSPELQQVLGRFPDQWSPQTAQMVRGTLRTWQERLLTPQQLAELEMTNRRLEIQDRGADVAERRAAAAERTAEAAMLRAERGDGAGSNQSFGRANSLRDEYNQQTTGYRTIADFAARSESYMQRVNAGQPSGQGDVGLVYALAKIYDPTSVVREGEFAMVAQQGGYGEQMRSWVETAQGRGFSTAIRAQIMTEIRNGVRAAEGQRNQTRSRYEALARRAGVDPALVIDDYSGGAGGPAGAPEPATRPPTVPDDYVWDGVGYARPD